MAAGLAMTIGALLITAGFVMAPPAIAAPAALTDAVGDVINRETNDKLQSAPTDIVGVSVDSGAQGIVLTFKTQETPDPLSSANWASPNTFVSWQIDSTGEGKVDDLIRFSLDRDTPGRLVGELTHWSGPGQPAKHCDAPATYNPTTGYTLTIDPSCMANPAAISYRVQLTYDTNPSGTKPPLAFDVVPDQGLAGPVSITIPTTPAQAPPPAGAPAPGPTADPAPAPTGAPNPSGAPTPTAPGAKPAPAAKPAPKPAAKPAAPAPARGGASTAAPKPAVPSAAPVTETSGELAATGSSARWLGAFGGALLLLGGLGLMTPVDRRRSTI
ncbi:MAG TPA: hypothetical protein VG795_13870 [Acidimicrobiia bacterium]|nr:hypothetical protein [Acidimicrobiia bacterium]